MKEDTIKAVGCKIINLHFGLTPYYRGSDTLLFPLYLQHPEHIGATLHEIDTKIDHGAIYHQQRTIFDEKDTMHDIFCKTVIQMAEPTMKLLNLLMSGAELKPYAHKKGGKVFYHGEFTPNHLKVIYDLINAGMIKRYLEGKSRIFDIEIYSCLEVSPLFKDSTHQ